MTVQNVKVVVFVPESHADKIREAIGKTGAGIIGNYSHCSFSSKGIGRFKPEKGSNPTVGQVGELTSVAEERIEFISKREMLKNVIEAIKKIHPYEEVALDVYLLESI